MVFRGRLRSNEDTDQTSPGGPSLKEVRGACFPGKFWKSCCLRLHFGRFEGRMIWKQASKSELKNVDIIRTVELQNWVVFGFILFVCFLAQRVLNSIKSHNRTERDSQGVGWDILISKKLFLEPCGQFPVTQLTSGEIVDFRTTRFHPKNGGQSESMWLWYG